MTPKSFLSLAAASGASLAAALLLYAANAPTSGSHGSYQKLVPSLADDASKIASIEITQGKDKLTLTKSGDAWAITSRDGYPASSERVRSLLIGLSEAELLESKTRNAEKLKLLSVEDPGNPNSNARLIRVLGENGTVLAETIAGRTRSDTTGASQGTYVRKPGDPQAWLASTAIEGGTRLGDWVEKRLYETPTEKIAEVEVTVAGEQPYTVKREQDQFVVKDMPAGKKLKYVNVTDLMIEAVSFFDLDDVRKPAGAPSGEPAGQATMKTDAGLTLTLKITRDKDAAWARIEASGTGDAAKAADTISQRTKGWEFKILPSKVSTLLKKRDDLLEDIPS